MKHLFFAVTVVLGFAMATQASAACYADYKAKQDNPLRLHYGVVALPDNACDKASAKAILAPRLANQGWTLLSVLAIFGPEGLAERKASAGDYYLRF